MNERTEIREELSEYLSKEHLLDFLGSSCLVRAIKPLFTVAIGALGFHLNLKHLVECDDEC